MCLSIPSKVVKIDIEEIEGKWSSARGEKRKAEEEATDKEKKLTLINHSTYRLRHY